MNLPGKGEPEEESNNIDYAKPQKGRPREDKMELKVGIPKVIQTMFPSAMRHETNGNNNGQCMTERDRINFLYDEARVDFHTAIKAALGDSNSIERAKKRREQERDPKKTGWLVREARKDISMMVSCLPVDQLLEMVEPTKGDDDTKRKMKERMGIKQNDWLHQILDEVQQNMKLVFQYGTETTGNKRNNKATYWSDATETTDSSDVSETSKEERRKMRRRAQHRHIKEKERAQSRRKARRSARGRQVRPGRKNRSVLLHKIS